MRLKVGPVLDADVEEFLPALDRLDPPLLVETFAALRTAGPRHSLLVNDLNRQACLRAKAGRRSPPARRRPQVLRAIRCHGVNEPTLFGLRAIGFDDIPPKVFRVSGQRFVANAL
eukprot:2952565-Alexandrium_andersonii.AAC.1